MSTPQKQTLSKDTLATQTVEAEHVGHSLALPIVTSSTYILDSVKHGALIAEHKDTEGASPWIYSRWDNPTTHAVAQALNALEGGEETFLFASGMAAISHVFLTFLSAGDHVVAPAVVYGGSSEVLNMLASRFQVKVTFVDGTDIANYKNAITPETKLLYGETPANPMLTLVDLKALANLGREHGIVTAVDSTFGTPYNQSTIGAGIDVVVNSCTKYLGGHSDLLAGSLTCAQKDHALLIGKSLRVFGAILNSHEAFLLGRGIKTLPVRMRQHNESGLRVAKFLQDHPHVESVNYPGLESHPQYKLACEQMSGFGGMLSFEVKGGVAAGATVAESVQLIKLAVSLGGVESLIEHPASMTHANMRPDQRRQAGISDGLIRLSVGLEDAGDLCRDLEQALAVAAMGEAKI